MDGELVGEVAALSDLDRVDLADEVGDRGVGCRELLAEPPLAVHPLDRGLVAALGDEHAGVVRDRVVGVVVDLAPRDDRHPLVEQPDERADHARLGLARARRGRSRRGGEQRVLELRQHGVLVPDHAVDDRLARRRCAGPTFSRTSCFTGREVQPLARSSPRVPGRVMQASAEERGDRGTRGQRISGVAHAIRGRYGLSRGHKPAARPVRDRARPGHA